ncbi:hypothetical protein IG631_15398 [Alternaria alternata]|nr:hypothetical protein IG631_15398 [Alternaria alternata]
MMMHRRNTLEQAVVAFSNSIYTFWNLTAPGCCSAKCAVPRCFSVRVAMYICVHACMQGYGPDGLPPLEPRKVEMGRCLSAAQVAVSRSQISGSVSGMCMPPCSSNSNKLRRARIYAS